MIKKIEENEKSFLNKEVLVDGNIGIVVKEDFDEKVGKKRLLVEGVKGGAIEELDDLEIEELIDGNVFKCRHCGKPIMKIFKNKRYYYENMVEVKK